MKALFQDIPVQKWAVMLSLLLFFNAHKNFAQSLSSIHSIQQDGADTTQILALTDLAYQLYITKSDSALVLAEQADSLSENISFPKGRGRALRVIGVYYWTKGNYSKALEFFKPALHFAELSKDIQGIANCYGNLGVVYRNQGNYEKALEYQLNSLKIREQIGGNQGIAVNHNNIGLIYKDLGNYNKALEYFFNSLKLHKLIDDKPGIARAYGNIGIVYQEQHEYRKALEFQLNSFNIQEEIGDKRGLTFSCSNLADIFISVEEFDKALFYLKKGLTIAREIKSLDRIANLNVIYAQYHSKNNEPLKAYQYAQEAQILAKKAGNMEVKRDALQQKYIAASRLGRYKEAMRSYEVFIMLRDSIKNEENNRKALSKEFAFKEERLKIDQEKKELEHLAEQEQQKIIAYSLGGISFTLIVLSLLIYRSNLQIKARNRKIKSQKKYIKEINRILELKALNAQVKPHFIFNCLNSINRYIVKEKPADASEYLAKFSKLIRMVLEYSDEQKITLSQELECLELYLKMEQLRLNNKFEYFLNVDNKLSLEDILVPPMILQPFVENSVWHGLYPKETNGTIKILVSQTDSQQIHYTVEDDGVGRAAENEGKSITATQKSFGVRSSIHRIKLLYKESVHHNTVRVIDLKNNCGKPLGTRVIITFPLQQVKPAKKPGLTIRLLPAIILLVAGKAIFISAINSL